MLAYAAPMLLLKLLWLCTGSGEAKILEQNASFTKQPVCPINASLAQLSKLEAAQDLRTCFVNCAVNASCSVLHRSNGICYFGDSSQLVGIFNQSEAQSSEPCVSHVRHDVRSKLVVLFDFRRSFTNLVSPGTFDATPHGNVTRDAQGAHFPGTSTSDFIEVDTQNGTLITEFLDHPHNFSFYAKVVRQTWYSQTYHNFYDCSSLVQVGRFGDRNGRAWVEHAFPGHSFWKDQVETRESALAPFKLDNTPQQVSLGAVFYGYTFNNFYLNGSSLLAADDKNWLSDSIAKCLRLGNDNTDDTTKSLNGRMICYAIAKAALSTVEFQQLDQMCEN